MGGKGGGGVTAPTQMPTPAPSPYETQLAGIASNLWRTTKPLRKSMVGGWMDFLDSGANGNFQASSLPGYTPMYDIARRGLENQYNTALQQTIAGTPRGGTMQDALSRLQQGRAESVGQLPGQISSGLIQDQINKAYGAAWNSPSQSIAGLSAANQGYVSSQNALLNAQMAAQMANNQPQGKGGLGMLGAGLGQITGSIFGGGPGTLGGRIGGKF